MTDANVGNHQPMTHQRRCGGAASRRRITRRRASVCFCAGPILGDQSAHEPAQHVPHLPPSTVPARSPTRRSERWWAWRPIRPLILLVVAVDTRSHQLLRGRVACTTHLPEIALTSPLEALKGATRRTSFPSTPFDFSSLASVLSSSEFSSSSPFSTSASTRYAAT